MGNKIFFNAPIYNFSNLIHEDLVMDGTDIYGNPKFKKSIKCSDNMVTKEIEIEGNFRTLVNESAVDVDYYEDDDEEESIQLIAPDNIIDSIHVEKRYDALIVKMDNLSISTNSTNRPRIVVKNHGLKSLTIGPGSNIKLHGSIALREIESRGRGEVTLQEGSIQTEYFTCYLNGSGAIYLNEIAADKMTLQLRGSGDIHINKATAKCVAIDILGSGNATISGKAELAKFNIMGTGDINASGLEVSCNI